MKIQCAHSEVVDIDSLVPHPRNPNQHSEKQIKYLAKIMKHQGWRHPVTVSIRSGFVVAGHGRIQAARANGWDKVPIDRQQFDTEADEYAHLVADNKIAELADLDMGMVNEDALKLGEDFDMDLLGIPDFEPVEITQLEPQCDEDEVPGTGTYESRAKPGDVWTLGRHRLMCGDSTNVQHLDALMAGEKADICFTSPPYNAGKNIRGTFYKNDSDDKSESEYVDFLSAVTSNCISVCDFVFVNLQLLESNKRSIVHYQHRHVDQLKDILIWNKRIYPPHINQGTFGCKWEYVFAFASDGSSRGFPCSWQGKFANVIETENNSGNEFATDHKAGFPVAFPEWVIDRMDFSKSVLDPFGGTGTTIIACEKTNRRCYMMELDPYYCDVILARWEKYTGLTATRLEQK